MRSLWIGWLLSGWLLSGCVEEPNEQPEPVSVPDPGLIPFWGPSEIYEEDGQCRDLLGATADTLTNRLDGDPYVSFPKEIANGTPITVSANGTLTLPNGGSMLGKKLIGTNGLTIRISSIGSDIYGATYGVEYSKGNGDWAGYCGPNEMATALSGAWSNTAFRGSLGRLSFGCESAAMKKCYGFGYVPQQVSSTPASLLAMRAHQACTRMARADICGDGTPGTRPETPIVIRDLIPGFNPPPSANPELLYAPINEPAPPDEHYFESMWSYKEDWGAVCMERDRWASVGPTSCKHLRDPRTHKDGQFCREISTDVIAQNGGLLANASKTQDRFIQVWRNADQDTVATIRGFRRMTAAGYISDPAPFAGYDEYLGTDGILLRNPPYSLDEDDVVPVFSLTVGTSDRIMGTSATLDSTDPTFEGYMLNSSKDTVRYQKYSRTRPDGQSDTITGLAPTKPGWNPGALLKFVFTAPAQHIEPLP